MHFVCEFSAVKFIRDKASEKDFFGSHSKVSKAISRIIKEHDDVKVIGLLGGWGSGKSTVLKLAEDEFKEDKDKENHFFFFDAWLHQSDPPRRAFIESLIAFLNAKGLTDKDDWSEDLDRLSRRAEDHEVKTTPLLTVWGSLFAASLFLVPMGLQFMGKDYSGYWVIDGPCILDFSLRRLGALITLLPILILLTNYFWYRPSFKIFSKDFWKTNRKPYEDKNILALFVNKSVDSVKNRIIKTPDPTAVEFREAYQKVLKAVSNPKKRFVFIIDNLDRVPEEEALKLWATVRSFFLDRSDEISHQENPNGIHTPWVILPLDPTALERIYSDSQESDAEARQKEAKERVQAFIDKTFDVTFNVSPPVVSDWRNYLSDKLIFALGNRIDDDLVHFVCQLFDISNELDERGSHKVTPRRINSYVNTIVSIYIAWEQEKEVMPIEAIAYFAAFQKRLSENVKLIFSDPPAEKEMTQWDSNWREQIASLHFGVDKKKALQLLVSERLEGSIIKAYKEEFKEEFEGLMETPGCDLILENICQRELSSTFVMSFFALYKGIENHTPAIENAKNSALQYVNRNYKWEESNQLTQSAIDGILLHLTEDEASKFIRTLSTNPGDLLEDLDGWVNIFVHLYKNHQNVLSKSFKIPGDGSFYVQAIQIIEERLNCNKGEGVLEFLKPRVESHEVVNALVTSFSTSKFNPKNIFAIQTLTNLNTKFDWGPLINEADGFIKNSSEKLQVTGAVHCLFFLLRHEGDKTFNDICNSGRLHFLLNHFSGQEKNTDVLGALLTAIIYCRPENAQNPNNQNFVNGVQYINNLTANLNYSRYLVN